MRLCSEGEAATKKPSRCLLLLHVVRRMIDAIICRNASNLERIDSNQAGHIETILAGIGPPLMVCIDAALRAKVVLRRSGVELIKLQVLFTPKDSYSRKRNRCCDCSPATTERAVTSPHVHETFTATPALSPLIRSGKWLCACAEWVPHPLLLDSVARCFPIHVTPAARVAL